jgi:protein farnesyltransferase subunit beta
MSGDDDHVVDIDVTTRSASNVPTRADLAAFRRVATPSQGVVTETWHQQRAVEQEVFLLQCAQRVKRPDAPLSPLLRDAHVLYLSKGLVRVPESFKGLNASQPWLLYWMLHAQDILGSPLDPDTASAAVEHLRLCRDVASGGFGGGPGQEPHLACTYAAVAALVVIGTTEALGAVQPAEVRRFVVSLKRDDGGFAISPNGEKDVRSLYSAIACASMAGVLDEDLIAGVGDYVRSLISFDGGIGGEPGTEAHGGNTYCGVAAAALAAGTASYWEAEDMKPLSTPPLPRKGAVNAGDTNGSTEPGHSSNSEISPTDALISRFLGREVTDHLVDWAAMRQCRVEGGFCGRTNKLVDSCYSFWVGALFPILGAPRAFNADALQRYILVCCQDEDRGGLRDKPGVKRDYHHTCYALSGLSVAQHYGGATIDDQENRVRKVDVLHNVCDDRVQAAWRYFEQERV